MENPLYDIAAVGNCVIVIGAVVVNCAQPPDAATVYVTVYVPAAVSLTVTVPVPELMVRPAGDAVYVPPVVPVLVTVAVVPFEQYGEPA